MHDISSIVQTGFFVSGLWLECPMLTKKFIRGMASENKSQWRESERGLS